MAKNVQPNNSFKPTQNLPRKSRHFQLTLGGVEWGSQA
jgi:hypothetical protein